MLKYKMDVMEKLKEAGYNTTRIRAENLLSQSTLQYIRQGKPIGANQLNDLCDLLDCQPGDILEFVRE